MAKALYLVIQSRDNWWVDFEGKAHGPFASRSNAVWSSLSDNGRSFSPYRVAS